MPQVHLVQHLHTKVGSTNNIIASEFTLCIILQTANTSDFCHLYQ